MIDIKSIKQQYDLRDIVEQDLGQPQSKSGRAYSYRCPFHNEQNGHSFVVWADGYKCFGKCDTSGDLLSWLTTYRNLSFVDAIQSLGSQSIPTPKRRVKKQEHPISPPSRTWQLKAKQIMRVAVDNMWRESGQFAREYLYNRGLDDETIRLAQLGYIPGYFTEWKRLFGLSVPCGILIPWIRHDDIWALKVRRAARQPKYQMVKGSRPHIPYSLTDGNSHQQAILCEGEFDAMLLHQEASTLVDVFTIGSASTRMKKLTRNALLSYRKVWLAYDNDEAGQQRVQKLMNISARMHPLHIPFNGDITDAYLVGFDITKWIETSCTHHLK